MIAFSSFEEALPLSSFLAQYGTIEDRQRWSKSYERVQLQPEQIQSLQSFTRTMNILMLAGAWCGDCSSQCSIIEKFVSSSPKLQIRYLDRDSHPEIMHELSINGGKRVPVVVVFSEDGHEVSRYGERTHTAYKKLMKAYQTQQILQSQEQYEASVVADWLREIERSQWILRLSARLKRLHGD